MSLPSNLTESLLNLTGRTKNPTESQRLSADGQRLLARTRHLADLCGITQPLNWQAIETACLALQLPLRHGISGTPASQPHRPLSLRDRCDQAIELIAGLAADENQPLVTQASELLRQLTRKNSSLNEARLLADSLSLEDFGLIGLLGHAMALGRHQASLTQLADGLEKKLAYGYWEIRLKDSFFFDQSRELARKRMHNAISAVTFLTSELKEDQHP
jgi:hypothetical protein